MNINVPLAFNQLPEEAQQAARKLLREGLQHADVKSDPGADAILEGIWNEIIAVVEAS